MIFDHLVFMNDFRRWLDSGLGLLSFIRVLSILIFMAIVRSLFIRSFQNVHWSNLLVDQINFLRLIIQKLFIERFNDTYLSRILKLKTRSRILLFLLYKTRGRIILWKFIRARYRLLRLTWWWILLILLKPIRIRFLTLS